MRIGIYISPAHAVPPKEHNILAPWMLVQELANGLVKQRHTVTLFAAKGSKTTATLVHGNIEATVTKRSSFGDVDLYRSFVIAQELALMREVIAYAKSGKLDIVHIHQPVERLYPALLAMPAKIPVVITFHDPITKQRFPALEKIAGLGNIHFVSLSKSQQNGVPFTFAGIVPNGIDITKFRPDNELKPTERSFLITGRIVPQKGFSDAIAAARKSGVRLTIVGQEYEKNPEAKEYFETEVKPVIDGKAVIWESVVSQAHLIGHYQRAKALLFPIHWEEPFGLVLIEAMACGTPVIAYNCGSVSEIVKDGLNGFIIEKTGSTTALHTVRQGGVEGLVEAIQRIDSIDRAACRSSVESQYTIQHMVRAYEAVYTSLGSPNT